MSSEPPPADGTDRRPLVTPGSPTLENAAFVVLGMLVTAAIVVHTYGVFTG